MTGQMRPRCIGQADVAEKGVESRSPVVQCFCLDTGLQEGSRLKRAAPCSDVISAVARQGTIMILVSFIG